MGKTKETPRYRVYSVRMTEDERKAAKRLTGDEARAALAAAGRLKWATQQD